MLIDAKVKTEPRAWKISKINRIATKGTVVATLAQDHFDQNNDYIELNDEGNVIGLWADYYSNGIIPEDYAPPKDNPNIHSEIFYSGLKSELKVGGSYKTFTVKYFIEDQEISFEPGGVWTYILDGVDITTDISEYLEIKDISPEQFKIKFLDKNSVDSNQKYIGKILNIKYSSASSECDLDIAIVSL